MGVGEMEREFRREGTYVQLWLIHVDVWQKPIQYCKAVILQLKRKKKDVSGFEDGLINNSAYTFPSSINSVDKLAPSPKYLLTCYFSSQLTDCQEFIKHPSQNENASSAICKREPPADPSRTRVPRVVSVSWKLANPSLWVEKLTECF